MDEVRKLLSRGQRPEEHETKENKDVDDDEELVSPLLDRVKKKKSVPPVLERRHPRMSRQKVAERRERMRRAFKVAPGRYRLTGNRTEHFSGKVPNWRPEVRNPSSTMTQFKGATEKLSMYVHDVHEETVKGTTVVRLYGVTSEKHGSKTVMATVPWNPHVIVPIPTEMSKAKSNAMISFLCKSMGASRIVSHRVEYRRALEGYQGDRRVKCLVITVNNHWSIGNAWNTRKLKSQGRKPKTLHYLLEDVGFRNETYILCHTKETAFDQLLNQTGIRLCSWNHIVNPVFTPNAKKETTCQLELSCMATDLISDADNQTNPDLVIACIDGEMVAPKGCFPNADYGGDLVNVVGCKMQKKDEDPLLMAWCLGNATHPTWPTSDAGHDGSSAERPLVFRFSSERDMLIHIYDTLIKRCDVDVISGYNNMGFDWPYFLARAKANNCYESHWQFLGKHVKGKYHRSDVKVKDSSSKGRGRDVFRYVMGMAGRPQFDVMRAMFKESLETYDLKSVAKAVLPEGSANQKDDVPYSELLERFEKNQENSDSFGDVVKYCIQDAVITDKIARAKCKYLADRQLACLTGVPLMTLQTSGEQIKIWKMIIKKCHTEGWLRQPEFLDALNKLAGAGYTGGAVKTATLDYMDFVTTLDFASLYPSIMIGNTLCFSTIIFDDYGREHAEKMNYEIVKCALDNGKTVEFVQDPNAFFPPILVELLKSRGEAKKKMKAFREEADLHRAHRDVLDGTASAKKMMEMNADILHEYEAERASLDARALSKVVENLTTKVAQSEYMGNVYDQIQGARKVVCNSAYGFFGAINGGYMPCVPIAAACCKIGRDMLDEITEFTECHSAAVGEDAISALKEIDDIVIVMEDCLEDKKKKTSTPYVIFKAQVNCVVYGDTDSIMTKFGIKVEDLEMQASCRLAEEPNKEADIKTWLVEQVVGRHIAMGKVFAKECSKLFRDPIRLEFEKVFDRYMQFGKKKYAGRKWEVAKIGKVKLMVRGLESIRRDWCHFTRTACKGLLDQIIMKDDIKKAIRNLRGEVSRLERGDLDVEELILTQTSAKGLEKPWNEPTDKPNVYVVRKILERNPECTVEKRIRMLGVYKEGAPDFENFEEASFALAHEMQINLDWYVRKQVIPPIKRLMKYILTKNQVDRLFQPAISGVFQRQFGVEGLETHFQDEVNNDDDTKEDLADAEKIFAFKPTSYYIQKREMVKLQAKQKMTRFFSRVHDRPIRPRPKKKKKPRGQKAPVQKSTITSFFATRADPRVQDDDDNKSSKTAYIDEDDDDDDMFSLVEETKETKGTKRKRVSFCDDDERNKRQKQ
jgi:DNA polymerase elongation subunit (family B)